jgi:hypothetical protein
MKSVHKAILGLAFSATMLSGAAVPASAEILFYGEMRISAVTPACTDGPSVDDIFRSRFHPAAAPGNSNFSALNRIVNFSANSWRLDSGSFTSSFQQVHNNGIGWSDYTPDLPSFLLVSKQTPATIIATTTDVVLVGKIKNPFGNIGQESCVATFRMVGIQSD